MIGVVIATVLIAAVVFVVLRREPEPPPVTVTLTLDTARLVESIRRVGISFRELAGAQRRATVVFAVAGDTWARDLHRPLADDVPLCWLHRRPWPCPDWQRLNARVQASRAELAELAGRSEVQA